MAWFCMNCGNRMYGTSCGGRWRSEGKYVRCNRKYLSTMAERIPPLDGEVFFNDDGTGITRQDQREYDILMCKRNKSPKVTKGIRPPGWDEAMERIGDREYAIMEEYTGCLPLC